MGQLVLTRRVGEEILIGDDIRIMVVARLHGAIWIGIEAPDGVKILRKEVYEREKKETKGEKKNG